VVGTSSGDKRLDMLLLLAEAITASPGLHQVLERVVQSACSLVADSVSSLWTLEDSRLVLRVRGGARRADPKARSDFALGEGLVGLAALERRTVLVDDILADPRTVNRGYFEAEALVAAAVIPLVSRGDLVGALALYARRASDLGPAEVEMLTAFGGQAAIAIQSAQLYAQAERRRREAETLADIVQHLAESHDLDTILVRITEGAHALCGGDVASLALRETDGSFAARYVMGARTDAYKRFRVVPGLGLGGHAVVSGRPRRAAERVAWPPMPAKYAEPIDAEGIRSALVAPIVIGEPVGLLYVCSREPRSFSEADESILLRLADHAATAIRSGRLFALVAGEREILGQIAAETPITTVLESICRLIESQREELRVAILRFDPASRRLRPGAAPSLPDAYVRAVDGMEIGACAGSCGTAVHRKEPVIVTDIATDPLWDAYRDLALPLGLRACWSWPVLDGGGEVLATFAVLQGVPRGPRPDEVELVTRAAQITRIALERERVTEALRRSEEQYRALVNNIPVVTWLADNRGHLLFISPHVVNVLGFTADEVMATGVGGWLNLVHPDDMESVLARYRDLARRHPQADVEYRVRHKDGRSVWVHSRAVSTYERDRVVYLTGVMTDITDRKEAETARELIIRQVVNVQEAERAKLSRELHDETAQLLAALLLGLRRLKNLRSLAEAQPQIERLHAVAKRALAEVRRMSRGLRPRVLDDLGLVPALEHHAAEYGEMRGLTIDVQTAGLDGERLPSEVETAFYRIMQEALSNVARHSGASKASVTVERQGALVRMTVADEGSGFDAGAVLKATDGAANFGLHSIRERAAVLRGTATFDSAPGQGTRVVVEIPLRREAS
jgi:PAS domain S-box-containing protein